MDTIDTTPATDIIVTEDAVVVEDYSNNTFAKEVTKTLVISIATTAGMIGGVLVTGFAYEKFQQFKARRATKETTIEGEVDGTPTTEPLKNEK